MVRREGEADACQKDHELHGFHLEFPPIAVPAR
jgi:hypothetical protein